MRRIYSCTSKVVFMDNIRYMIKLYHIKVDSYAFQSHTVLGDLISVLYLVLESSENAFTLHYASINYSKSI